MFAPPECVMGIIERLQPVDQKAGTSGRFCPSNITWAAALKGAAALFFLGFLLTGWMTLVAADSPGPSPSALSVNPSEAYTGDTIEITLRSLPNGYRIPGGSVTLAGLRLQVPGVFGAGGTQPIAGPQGDVTFTTQVPVDTPIGVQTLVAANNLGGEDHVAPLKVLTSKISFSPTAAVPNQTVTLRGSRFSSFTRPGGMGALGVHQITGKGESGVEINGVMLDAPHVSYPIDLDTDGHLTAQVTLPRGYVFSNGALLVKVIDDAGRSGSGPLQIKARSITLQPAESGRGSTVTVTGSGFVSTQNRNNFCTTVDLTYAGQLVKQITSDRLGDLKTEIVVPLSAVTPSSNTVKATLSGCTSASVVTAIHKIPARSLKITPAKALAGSTVTVTGVGFLGFTPISALTMGQTTSTNADGEIVNTKTSVLPSSSPYVNKGGDFSVDIVVPSLKTGYHSVSVTAGNQTETASFLITATAPTPIPVLAPATGLVSVPAPVSETLATLLQPLEDNLSAMWTFQKIDGWQLYSPDDGFANQNPLTTLNLDQAYWIRVREDQKATLNGRDRTIYAGWNLIHW